MDFKIDKEQKTAHIPTTIEGDMFFQMKVFYGFLIMVYLVLGFLVVVG